MTRSLAVLTILLILAAPVSALAEEFVDPHWIESPINFSAGFKFGLAFPGDDTVQEVYGSKGIPYYNIEAGWKIVHELELHWEWSYFWEQGRGVALTGEKTNEQYKLHVSPMELGLTYRFNFVYDQPIVPFLGAGGDFTYYFEERLESSLKNRGLLYGYMGKGGIMILLDNAEKRASGALERQWGINNTYFIYSYKYVVADRDFSDGDDLDLSHQAHSFGILFEF